MIKNSDVLTKNLSTSLNKYLIGYSLSIFLSIFAYLIVVNKSFNSQLLLALVAGLAIIQFIVQMVFFLHLGSETKPRWKLYVFTFMLSVVIIIVAGSIWIMSNLNYHTMTPHDIDNYMSRQVGL
ncbi:MAG: cytochrome o ubiquinol oxidase subunit IV [Candidatus Saccharimonadales bacterium]